MLLQHSARAQPGGDKVQERQDFSRDRSRSTTFRRFSVGLGAALIALAAIPAAAMVAPAAPVPVAAQAGPALWVVHDADTTIYLFGTFHALDGRSNWFSHGVRAAFDASDQLVL